MEPMAEGKRPGPDAAEEEIKDSFATPQSKFTEKESLVRRMHQGFLDEE